MADNGTIEIMGLEERIKKFGELSTKNPEMRRRINEVIRQVIAVARRSVSADAKTGLQMDSDPRQAYKAVRMAVYRRIFGGQINILSPRNQKTLGRLYEPPRKIQPKQRGGNRVKRSDRTTEIMSYMGSMRGFVLRFLNDGTAPRYAGFGRNGRTEDERNKFILRTGGAGFRGAISAKNWFGNKSHAELEEAAKNLDVLIDRIVQGIMY